MAYWLISEVKMIVCGLCASTNIWICIVFLFVMVIVMQQSKKKPTDTDSALVFRAVERTAAPGTEPEIRSIRQAHRSFPPQEATEFEVDLEISRSQVGLRTIRSIQEGSGFSAPASFALDEISHRAAQESIDEAPELLFDAPSFEGLDVCRKQITAQKTPYYSAPGGLPGGRTGTGAHVLERPIMAPLPMLKTDEVAAFTQSLQTHSNDSSDAVELSEHTSDSPMVAERPQHIVDDLVQDLIELELEPIDFEFASEPIVLDLSFGEHEEQSYVDSEFQESSVEESDEWFSEQEKWRSTDHTGWIVAGVVFVCTLALGWIAWQFCF